MNRPVNLAPVGGFGEDVESLCQTVLEKSMEILSIHGQQQSVTEVVQHLDLIEQLITLFNRVLDNNRSSDLVLNSDDYKQLEDFKVCFSDFYQQFIEAHLKNWSDTTLCSSIPVSTVRCVMARENRVI